LAYSALGRFGEALDALERGLEGARQTDRFQLGLLLIETGRCLAQTGRFQEAAGRFNEALVYQRLSRDRDGEARSLVGLAAVQRELGDIDGARDSLSQALTAFRELRDPQAAAVQAELERLQEEEGGST
jgi:tetratricopeptide (TPR) repeat protein